MDEEEHIGGADSVSGPRSLREEVARPERLGMRPEKHIPRCSVPRGLRAEPGLDEDAPDRRF